MTETFLGYERPDGQMGIRNWVGVLSVMDNVNPIAAAICQNVAGTLLIKTLFVRGQYGRDLEITYNTLAGMGRNPNLASILVVGLEETSTSQVADRIRNCGKPVDVLLVQNEAGSIAAMAEGIRKAAALAVAASSERRKPVPVSALCIGVECGGSDTTSGLAANPCIGRVSDRIVEGGGKVVISETSEFLGAEHLFAERAIDETVRKAFLDRVDRMEKEALMRGVDIRGTNPVADNIRGGLTTIEEKSLGATAKAGTTPLVGVLDYGEAAVIPGMHFMATPAPAVESMTGLAAGGCQLILFSTGVGNMIGNMVSPTIKITANANTARRQADNIDVEVTSVLESDRTIEEAGDELFRFVLDVASGTLTRSEVLDMRETAVSRFEPTI
ncbi:MAG: altronate hydrolase [Rhizobiales bacterium 65-79]|jgi:altronate dehydratase large subunit|nr:UxaA family hydrolase [Hyphomicrobiales bacterium]OJU05763.1 MAG: altronate hydrolase [Rhizobiales bacterium 65-79]